METPTTENKSPIVTAIETPVITTAIPVASPVVAESSTATLTIPVSQPPSVYPHEQLIAEEKINVKELPKEIKNQLGAWNLQRLRFDKTKSEGIGMTVKKKSVFIADMIQNHLEKDLPEQVIAPVVPPVVEKTEEQKRLEEQKNNTGENSPMFRKQMMNVGKLKTEKERLILKNMDAKGYIHYKKVGEILDIKTFPFSVRVSETMVLDYEYMSDFYVIRKKSTEKK